MKIETVGNLLNSSLSSARLARVLVDFRKEKRNQNPCTGYIQEAIRCFRNRKIAYSRIPLNTDTEGPYTVTD